MDRRQQHTHPMPAILPDQWRSGNPIPPPPKIGLFTMGGRSIDDGSLHSSSHHRYKHPHVSHMVLTEPWRSRNSTTLLHSRYRNQAPDPPLLLSRNKSHEITSENRFSSPRGRSLNDRMGRSMMRVFTAHYIIVCNAHTFCL